MAYRLLVKEGEFRGFSTIRKKVKPKRILIIYAGVYSFYNSQSYKLKEFTHFSGFLNDDNKCWECGQDIDVNETGSIMNALIDVENDLDSVKAGQAIIPNRRYKAHPECYLLRLMAKA